MKLIDVDDLLCVQYFEFNRVKVPEVEKLTLTLSPAKSVDCVKNKQPKVISTT